MTERAAALACAAVLAATAGAQDVTDADLARASNGRSVRVRVTSGDITSNGSPAVVDLPIEQYVARVLAAEGEPRAGAAAQQAVAVAIRTFAVANAGRHRRDGFDLCDTTHCQVVRPATPASRAAASATALQVLMHEGRPAMVFYSASCGGRSEAAAAAWAGRQDLPYLRSVRDDVHDASERWVADVPLRRLEGALRRLGFAGARLRDVAIDERTGSGRVTQLRLSGFRPDLIRAEDLRAAIGVREIRSTQFTVKRRGTVLRFTGRGYGHGVGLCVVGAGRRAARGETAQRILQQYYPGLSLLALPSGTREVVAVMPPLVARSVSDGPPGRASRANALAMEARTELAATLRIPAPPEIRVEVHPSLDSFRAATNRPWWVAFAVSGSVIELAPQTVLEQSHDGLDLSVRRAVAEVLTAAALAGRPEWIRVGAARYYAARRRAEGSTSRRPCPADAELTMPVSAAAHRDAERRAEACFARAIAEAADWRALPTAF